MAALQHCVTFYNIMTLQQAQVQVTFPQVTVKVTMLEIK